MVKHWDCVCRECKAPFFRLWFDPVTCKYYAVCDNCGLKWYFMGDVVKET